MKALPNNCRVGKITIAPAEWEKGGKAALKKEWYISYRFYDDTLGKSKQVTIRGFGTLDNLKDRRQAIAHRLKMVERDLFDLGYNPITNSSVQPLIAPGQVSTDISKQTPFLEALKYAKGMMKVAGSTMHYDIDYALIHIERAAKALKYDEVAIWDISLKNLYFICEKGAYKRDKTFSGDKFNRLRKVLGYFYKKLLMMEVVVANLPLSLENQKLGVRKKKVLPTKEERERLTTYLKAHDPKFLRFLNIFFHSGSRISEIFRVRVKDVDLKNGSVKYLILKGRRHEEKYRPIKDVAVALWAEVLAGAQPDDYVFGKDYKPNAKEQTTEALRLKWQKLRKKPELNMSFGLYSLKHLNSTQTAELLGTRAAALQNAESEDMIRKHYDLDHDKRINEQIKKLKNEL